MNERSMLSARPWKRPQHLSSVPYLPGLDGMRALAVVIVMVYHANPDWLHGGFLGVEVFFVISGYLITLLLMAETERTGRIDLFAFWGRRFRRLLPALYALLFVVVVYTAFFRADRLTEVRGDVIAAIAYVANWWQIWIGADYAGADRFAPLNHLWSLAVEEQFYLVWPIVMLLMLRRGSRRMARVALWLVAIAVGITIANGLLIYTGPVTNCETTPQAYWQFFGRCFNKPNTLYLSTVSRAGGLLIGSAFAMLWRPVAIMRGPLREANKLLDLLSLLALAALGFLSYWIYFKGPGGITDGWLFRVGFLLTDLATVVVIAGVTHRYTLMGRALGNPVFVWVGQRSYGLYLYHWFIYQVIRRATGVPLTLTQFGIAIVITVALSEASYRLLETPIRKREVGAWWAKLRRQSDPVPRQVVSVMAVAAIVVLGFSTVKMWTARPPSDSLETSLEAGETSAMSDEQLLNGTPTATTTVPVAPVVATNPAGAPVTTAAATTAAPTTSSTTPLPDGKITKLAVGDSVMLGAAPYLTERGWVVSAAQNRQMAEAVPLLEQLSAEDRIERPVFIHLGTNGPITADIVEALLAPLSNINLVIMFNVHAQRNYTAQNNQILADAKKNHPNVFLVDWNTLATKCPGDCFFADGIHLKPDGRKYYEEIADKVWHGKDLPQ